MPGPFGFARRVPRGWVDSSVRAPRRRPDPWSAVEWTPIPVPCSAPGKPCREQGRRSPPQFSRLPRRVASSHSCGYRSCCFESYCPLHSWRSQCLRSSRSARDGTFGKAVASSRVQKQSGIATREDRANRARHADIRGRMTNYSKGKPRHQSDKDPTQSPIEKSYRDDHVAANQIRPIRFADYYCCCCCCCSCSVRVLRGANTGRDWITMLGATGSGSGASEGLTVTATLSSLCASPL